MIPIGLRELQVRQGAKFRPETNLIPSDFFGLHKEYTAAKKDAALFDISYRSKLEVSGPDAPLFLNNLCTNQILDLPLGDGCEAFFTTAKAKIIAHTRVYHIQHSDGRHCNWLDSSPGRNSTLLQHLDKHLISEQVEFADRTEDFCQFHLVGPRAKDVLEKCLGETLPPLAIHQNMMRPIGGHGLCNIRFEPIFNIPAYDIVCLNSRGEALWKIFSELGAVPAGEDSMEILRLEAGYPSHAKEFDETTFLPEIDRALQAISSTKGCFLGQEPIVMARDRGQVNRKLRGLLLADKKLEKGTPLYKDGNEIGWVTSSSYSPEMKGNIALCFLRRGFQEKGSKIEYRQSEQTLEAVVHELPFHANFQG